MKFLQLFLHGIGLVSAKYILTLKHSVPGFNVVNFANEYMLEPLADFGFLTMYESSHENVMKHRKVLHEHFDIEEDGRVSIDDTVNFILVPEKPVPWHLDRIVKQNLPLDNTFEYNYEGSCHRDDNVVITTYIVDTGVDIHHSEFEGRAEWGANFADDIDMDCSKHGTHVAGLVTSKSYGVCKDAKVKAVKVLGCDGSGSMSGVIKGIEWVYSQHLLNTQTESSKVVKSIINMSLGGGYSMALNRVVEHCLQNDNFYIVVASGNENKDACNSSPASASGVLSVMASNSLDFRAWFSNHGKCANIYAPGVDVLSTVPGESTAVYSGTSMASPVMTGVLNHYIDMYPSYNQEDIIKFITASSSKDVISGFKPDTVSNLVYLER